jgi:hypothetical protein
MEKDELYQKTINEIVDELKIPLIRENIRHKLKTNKSKAIMSMKFKFAEDISVIKGFLGLADYYHSVVLQDDETYFIPVGKTLFILEN